MDFEFIFFGLISYNNIENQRSTFILYQNLNMLFY